MVEAVCVIPVFVLFFLGMTYFRQTYQEKLRLMRLARAAASAYALNGCEGDPIASIRQDLGDASDTGRSGQTRGSQAGPIGTAGSSGDPSVSGNQSSGNPVSSALGSSGMIGDPIAAVSLEGSATVATQSSAWAQRAGFHSTLSTSSYVSCGDVPKSGTAAGAWSYAEELFKL